MTRSRSRTGSLALRVARLARLACVALLGLQVVPLGAALAAPELRTYIVQPGDSAWSIAAELYGSGDKYPIVYEYNAFVGKPPFLLQPGQTLTLPVLGTTPAAQVEWLLRDVKAKPPRALDWLDARARMNLWRLYRVSTGDESAAHIVFEDTSDLRLRDNALLVIYGASASAARTSRRDKTEVVLEHGTIQGGLAALDAGPGGAAPMLVRTPSGAVDIMAGLVQIQAEAAASMVSVYEGLAAVSALGAKVEVPGGQGTVVKKGRRPEPARPLPDAPRWADAGGAALVPVLTGSGGGRWEARWTPVDEAATYRVELASDDSFDRVLYDAEVGAGVTGLVLAELMPGRYAVRVSTRDASQLESRPGPARALEVLPLEVSRRVELGPDGVPEVVGFARLALPAPAQEAGAERVTVSLAEPTPGPAAGLADARDGTVRLMRPGLHRLIFERSGAGAARGELTLRVLAVAAVFEREPGVVPRRAAPDDASLEVRFRVQDERGRPALLPDLVVEGPPGSLTVVGLDPGEHRATVPAVGPEAAADYPVTVRWTGGVLGALPLRAEPRAPMPTRHGRQTLPLTPHRLARDLPAPHVAILPETRLALDAMLVDEVPGPGAFGLVLRGEYALARWGLEAGFAFQDVRLEERGGTQSRLGNATLGARYLLAGPTRVGDEGIALAAFARVGLPVGAGHGPRLASVEPGLLLRLAAGAAWCLDVRASVLAASDLAETETTRLGGLVAVGWRPLEALTVSASAETVLGLDRAFAGHVAGLGANVEVGDLRLGLAFGLGLGGEAEAELGALFGRLVLDLGLLLEAGSE